MSTLNYANKKGVEKFVAVALYTIYLFFVAPGNSWEYEEKIRNLQEMGFDEVLFCPFEYLLEIFRHCIDNTNPVRDCFS